MRGKGEERAIESLLAVIGAVRGEGKGEGKG